MWVLGGCWGVLGGCLGTRYLRLIPWARYPREVEKIREKESDKLEKRSRRN